jgi:hypothetical protein
MITPSAATTLYFEALRAFSMRGRSTRRANSFACAALRMPERRVENFRFGSGVIGQSDNFADPSIISARCETVK